MAENSKIEWTTHTFNHVRGCTKVHEGCAHCYAERDAKRFPHLRGIWGKDGTRVMAASDAWRQPLKWNEEAAKAGIRARVFCASLADVFEQWDGLIHDHVGNKLALYMPNEGIFAVAPYAEEPPDNCRWLTMDDLRRFLFKLIDRTQNLDWQLVTKRPENVSRMWRPFNGSPVPGMPGTYRPNVWIMTSVSNQATADAMIPELLKCRDLVPVLGLSAEPLLGPIDFRKFIGYAKYEGNVPGQCVNIDGETWHSDDYKCRTCGWGYPNDPDNPKRVPWIDWVIVGGESGHGARVCDIGWIRSIRDQCKDANVACFVKQLGANVEWSGMQGGYMDGVPDVWPNDGNNVDTRRGNWRKILIDPKGGDWNEWPEDLRVREYPNLISR